MNDFFYKKLLEYRNNFSVFNLLVFMVSKIESFYRWFSISSKHNDGKANDSAVYMKMIVGKTGWINQDDSR